MGSHRRRVTLVALVAPIALIVGAASTSFMAGVQGPLTVAGVVHGRLAISTTLTADDAKVDLAQDDKVGQYYKFIGLGARLTTPDGPAPDGMTVVFSVGPHDTVVCRGITKDGRADCDDTKPNPNVSVSDIGSVPTSYTATFRRYGPFAGKTATGKLCAIGPSNTCSHH